MTYKTKVLLLTLVLLMLAPRLALAQTGVNIGQVGGTPVTSPLPVSATMSLAGTPLVNNPCQTAAGTTTAISASTSGTIIPLTSGKKTYGCALLLNTGNAAGETINIIEGTGATCSASQNALIGSTTAANGVFVAASGGGFVLGDGGYPIFRGATNSLNICLITSTGHLVAGTVTWVQQFYADPRRVLEYLPPGLRRKLRESAW